MISFWTSHRRLLGCAHKHLIPPLEHLPLHRIAEPFLFDFFLLVEADHPHGFQRRVHLAHGLWGDITVEIHFNLQPIPRFEHLSLLL